MLLAATLGLAGQPGPPRAPTLPPCCSPCPPFALPAARTHRELFSIFYADLMREPLEAVLAANPRPVAAVAFFGHMMRDLSGTPGSDVMQQVGG